MGTWDLGAGAPTQRGGELQQVAVRAAAAQRKKLVPGKPPVQFALADDTLPNGVGVVGRGRALVNAPLLFLSFLKLY